MDTVLILTVIPYAAIAGSFFLLVYSAAQKPSEMQKHVIVLTIAVILMLFGYTMEMQAETLREALLGTAVSYLGKPFIMLSSEFAANARYTPLVQTHGPLYILNVITSAVFFVGCVGAIAVGYHRSSSPNKRRLSVYSVLMVLSAAMHDVGKISVKDSILQKPGRLTPEEFDEMKIHAPNGAKIIRSTMTETGLWTIRRMEDEEYGCEEQPVIYVAVELENEAGQTRRVRIPEDEAGSYREGMSVHLEDDSIFLN